MEYKKISLLDQIHQINLLNLLQKIELNDNDNACGTYNINNQGKFKSSMLESSLCDYSDAYIFLSGTIQSQHKQETTQIMLIKNSIQKSYSIY